MLRALTVGSFRQATGKGPSGGRQSRWPLLRRTHRVDSYNAHATDGGPLSTREVGRSRACAKKPCQSSAWTSPGSKPSRTSIASNRVQCGAAFASEYMCGRMACKAHETCSHFLTASEEPPHWMHFAATHRILLCLSRSQSLRISSAPRRGFGTCRAPETTGG